MKASFINFIARITKKHDTADGLNDKKFFWIGIILDGMALSFGNYNLAVKDPVCQIKKAMAWL